MQKITIPVLVGMPTQEEHTLQLALLPDGAILGRVAIPNAPGRVNSLRIMDPSAIPGETLVFRAGEVEVNEEMLKEVATRGRMTSAETPLRDELYHAWKTVPMVLATMEKTEDWLARTSHPSWTKVDEAPAPVVEAPPALALGALTIRAHEDVIQEMEEEFVPIMSRESLEEALEIRENQSAWIIPEVDEDWVPMKFSDTDIMAEEYLERTMESNRKSNRSWNISITGRTGSGKSTLLRNFAAKRGIHYASIPFSEATDTTSLWDEPILVPDGKGGTRSIRVLTSAGMCAVLGGLIECAEISAAADTSLTGVYETFDAGRMITLSNGAKRKVHKETLFVSTQNPVDAAHTHASHMSAALDRRFWHVEMDYDEDVEKKLVPVDALRELAAEIRNTGITQPFSTDSLVKVHHAITDFGLKQGITGLITMFRDPAAREVIRPLVDVRIAELEAAYGQHVGALMPEVELDF